MKVFFLIFSLVSIRAFAAQDPRFTYEAATAQFASAKVPTAADVSNANWMVTGQVGLEADDASWYSPDGKIVDDNGLTYWARTAYVMMTNAFGQNPQLMQTETDTDDQGRVTTQPPRAGAATAEGIVFTSKGSHGPCETKYEGDGTRVETCQNTCANKLIDRMVGTNLILRAQQFTDLRSDCNVFNTKKPQSFILFKKL